MSHVSGDIWNEKCYESKLQNADFPPAICLTSSQYFCTRLTRGSNTTLQQRRSDPVIRLLAANEPIHLLQKHPDLRSGEN